MKVLLAGDTHADINHLRFLCEQANASGCNLIIQVGDFGFGFPLAPTMADATAVLDEHEVPLWFVDGNHDRHDLLNHDSLEPVQLTERIRWLPRGHRWDLGGCRFMSFGGAVSVDKDRRRRYVDWWQGEAITVGQVRRVIDDPRPVDVLLTHDTPFYTEPVREIAEAWPVSDRLEVESASNRALLREVAAAVDPCLVVHGHWHRAYVSPPEVNRPCWVVGLADGSQDDSFTVLDTADWVAKKVVDEIGVDSV